MMKKLLSVTAVFMIFLVGCSEQVNINSPENLVNAQEPNWITLPKSEELNVEASYSASEWVSGYYGDKIYLYKSYYVHYFNKVTINAKIDFPQYSFWGSKYITMTIDNQTCTATFSPSMEFNKPAILNITFTGIDLSNINPLDIDFAYLATDGTVQFAQHEGITMNISSGTLSVKNAKIPHFSRYGFIRKDSDE